MLFAVAMLRGVSFRFFGRVLAPDSYDLLHQLLQIRVLNTEMERPIAAYIFLVGLEMPSSLKPLIPTLSVVASCASLGFSTRA